MLLFDIIRDWFVMYIWGGYTSGAVPFSSHIGNLFSENGDLDGLGTTVSYLIPIGKGIDNNIDGTGQVREVFISFGDWLSTTSTIIVMILLCVVFGLMVRWLFRLTAGLLRGN